VIILAITALVEIGLGVLARRAPALVHLVRPVYIIVLLAAAGAVWHALRRHPGRDRRRSDRRAGAE
jgi:hypothetical protein